MIYGSVCSGIEAATQAWQPLGWRAAFFSEIEKFPSAVLAHHYGSNMPGETPGGNGIPNYGDMTGFKEWPDHAIDILVGGTPCQSFSVAGLRKGLADPRGNLMLTFGAIAQRYKPKWIVWENVPGVLSSEGGRDFGTFLRLLGECGYGFAYRVLDAQFVRVDGFGRAVPQRRRRVFVVGYLGDWRRAAAVLFEPESVPGNPAPRRRSGKGVAGTLDTGIGRRRGSGMNPNQLTPDVANPLTARMHKGINTTADEGQTPLPIAFKSREDTEVTGNRSGPLGAGLPQAQAVAFDMRGRKGGAQLEGPHDTANIRAADGGSSRSYVAQPMAVRRLTPRECERLQGFPEKNESVMFTVCPDGKSPLSADAEKKCTTKQINALSAGEKELAQNASSADVSSCISPVEQRQPVVLSVRLNLETEQIQIFKAGKLIFSVKTAGPESQSPLPIPVGDFARLVAVTTQTAAKTIPDGRVVSQMTENHSFRQLNGKTSVDLSGLEIREHASAVERFIDMGWMHSTLTTSPSIANIPVSASILTTLCCCVLNVIASFIPKEMIGESSYSIEIETVSGFTRIPWRNRAELDCPDGPRYKALGNSMAVNVIRWLGLRIEMIERLSDEVTARDT